MDRAVSRWSELPEPSGIKPVQRSITAGAYSLACFVIRMSTENKVRQTWLLLSQDSHNDDSIHNDLYNFDCDPIVQPC